MGLQLTAEDRHHLTGVIDALAKRFEGTFSRATVERFVNDSLARFENARITMHLPVLAERLARRRLEALGRAEGAVVDPNPEVMSRSG
jgi:arsenate reductase (thioredoxin)